MTSFGNLLLALAAISAFISVGALIWGHSLGEKQGEGTTNIGYLATFGVLLFATLAVLVLLLAFFTQNFTFQYVVENHTTDISSLRWLYQLSGVWAGREGSLLFWEWLLACFAAFVAYKRLSVTDRLSNVALAITNFIQLFFLAALFIPANNPFKVSPSSWFDPNTGKLIQQTAMNPLLQHWAMIAHPPTLFLGYAGLAIPFAFAIAALILNDSSKTWVELSNRITVFAWLLLGVGIGLGAIWAYVVLGWGGYWGWDPVENASLLPWLTGVGLIHSMTMYRRRGGFKGWAVMMASVTFALVILATFITRSGVVASVHTFQNDSLSFWLLLTLMVGAVAVGAIGLLIRRDTFRGDEQFESLTSREAAYYFNNVLMLVAAALVAYLTLSSAFPSWLPLGGQKFGAASYDNIARPVGIMYVLIMVACPILAWRKTEGAMFWSRFKFPAAVGTALSAVLVGIWYTLLLPIDAANRVAAATPNSGVPTPPPPILHNTEAVLALIVAGFALAMPLYLFYSGASKRAKSKGEGFGAALLNIITKARSQSGGYIAHLGVGIVLIGLVGSAMFVQNFSATLKQQAGQQFKVGGYVLDFQKVDQTQLANGDQLTTARFNLVQNGRVVGTTNPAELFNNVAQQSTRNVDIIHEPLRDVFVVLEGVNQDGTIQMSAKVNPLISFSWIGFVLILLGSTIAVWPKRQAVAA